MYSRMCRDVYQCWWFQGKIQKTKKKEEEYEKDEESA